MSAHPANRVSGRFANKDTSSTVTASGSSAVNLGVIEATDLDLARLSIQWGRKTDDGAQFGFLKIGGEDVSLLVRGMAVVKEAHLDTYNNLKMEFKVPEDKQGSNLEALDGWLRDPTSPYYMPGVHFTNFFYGGDAHFVHCKVLPGALFRRENQSVKDEDIRKGELVDVLFSPMVRVVDAKPNDEGVEKEARWYLRVEQVKAFEKKPTEGAEPKGNKFICSVYLSPEILLEIRKHLLKVGTYADVCNFTRAALTGRGQYPRIPKDTPLPFKKLPRYDTYALEFLVGTTSHLMEVMGGDGEAYDHVWVDWTVRGERKGWWDIGRYALNHYWLENSYGSRTVAVELGRLNMWPRAAWDFGAKLRWYRMYNEYTVKFSNLDDGSNRWLKVETAEGLNPYPRIRIAWSVWKNGRRVSEEQYSIHNPYRSRNLPVKDDPQNFVWSSLRKGYVSGVKRWAKKADGSGWVRIKVYKRLQRNENAPLYTLL